MEQRDSKRWSEIKQFMDETYTTIIGHCNGLVCLKSTFGFGILNPYTREIAYYPIDKSIHDWLLQQDPSPSYLESYGFGTLTPGHDPIHKFTLIPRGQARGLTWFMSGEDPALISKQQLFARIIGGVGGRAAEEIVFGEPEITTGATGDLQQITRIAKMMVTTFGMSEIGPWALTDPVVQSSDIVLWMLTRNSMSEKLAEDIDNVYEIAKTHIINNREVMDKLVDVLLEKETLTGDEFRAILSEFSETSIGKINEVPVGELLAA